MAFGDDIRIGDTVYLNGSLTPNEVIGLSCNQAGMRGVYLVDNDGYRSGLLSIDRVDHTRTVRGVKVEAPPAPDLVNHPPHYTTGGIETIDFIRAKQLDYCLGNVVKYITRAPHKGNEVQDLKKARWYLDRAISERTDNLNKERDQ